MIIKSSFSGMAVAAGVIYRVHIKVKVFPNNNSLKTLVGDFGSSVLNVIFILILNYVYQIILLIEIK